jgi:SHS2 domain-containing protein
MMQEMSESGFLELAHTADWALQVWAPDLTRLLYEAARGMYVLMEIQLEQEQSIDIPIELEADDGESLLVAFLSELLYLGEEQGLAFDHFDLDVQDYRLSGLLHGRLINSQLKEIKAVTYHELEIIDQVGRLLVTVVFDV